MMFLPHTSLVSLKHFEKYSIHMKVRMKDKFQLSHRSSVGRAGDCKSLSIGIPRSMVRIRPVRFIFAFFLSYFKFQSK